MYTPEEKKCITWEDFKRRFSIKITDRKVLKEIWDIFHGAPQSTLSGENFNISSGDTASTDLIPGIILSEDWREDPLLEAKRRGFKIGRKLGAEELLFKLREKLEQRRKATHLVLSEHHMYDEAFDDVFEVLSEFEVKE